MALAVIFAVRTSLIFCKGVFPWQFDAAMKNEQISDTAMPLHRSIKVTSGRCNHAFDVCSQKILALGRHEVNC